VRAIVRGEVQIERCGSSAQPEGDANGSRISVCWIGDNGAGFDFVCAVAGVVELVGIDEIDAREALCGARRVNP
jgi:hypothetical protein